MRYFAAALDTALLGFLVLWAVLAMLLGISGCASFLQTADHASLVANRALAIAQREAHDARAHQLDACTDEPCLDGGAAQWAPWLAALEFARGLAADFDDALASAGRLGDSPDVERIVIEAACDLLRAWDRLPAGYSLLGPLHLSLAPPELPPELSQMLHTGEALLCPAP